mgnify:CR=1 FL=1
MAGIASARQPGLATTDGTRPSLLTRIGALTPVHIGRIMTYTVLGGLIGLAGSLLDQVSGLVGWQGFFSILVGLAMIESTAIYCFVVSMILIFANPFWNHVISQTVGK